MRGRVPADLDDGGGAGMQERRQRSPVFLGDTAFGILKGGSYRSDGSCAFYFYMSTDYLPTGWRLLMAEPATLPAING